MNDAVDVVAQEIFELVHTHHQKDDPEKGVCHVCMEKVPYSKIPRDQKKPYRVIAARMLEREAAAESRGLELGNATAKAKALSALIKLGDLCISCRTRFGG